MQLYHFSEEPGISLFVPRPVAVSAARPLGLEWLNGPLVWAIDDWHQPMYLFPRECPRILLWPTETTSAGHLRAHWTTSRRIIAYAEDGWAERIAEAMLYRYALPRERSRIPPCT